MRRRLARDAAPLGDAGEPRPRGSATRSRPGHSRWGHHFNSELLAVSRHSRPIAHCERRARMPHVPPESPPEVATTMATELGATLTSCASPRNRRRARSIRYIWGPFVGPTPRCPPARPKETGAIARPGSKNLRKTPRSSTTSRDPTLYERNELNEGTPGTRQSQRARGGTKQTKETNKGAPRPKRVVSDFRRRRQNQARRRLAGLMRRPVVRRAGRAWRRQPCWRSSLTPWVRPWAAGAHRGGRQGGGCEARTIALLRRSGRLDDRRQRRLELREGDRLAQEAQPRLRGPPLVGLLSGPADQHDRCRVAPRLGWPRQSRGPSIPA